MYYLVKRCAQAVAVMSACAVLSVDAVHARTIENPDDKTIQLLADYLAGTTPNFREEALNSYEYRQANEFDKPTVLDSIEAQLRSEFEGFASVEGLQILVGGNFGEYDAAEGVYRISVFQPGTYFPFNQGYGLFLDNAADFYEWALPVADARQIRELSPYGQVNVELIVTPFGVAPNDHRHVRGQIISMKMFEQRSGRLLHEVVLPADQHKSIQSAAAQRVTRVGDDVLTLTGLNLSMTADEAIAALEDAGYHVYQDRPISIRFSTNENRLSIGLDTLTREGKEPSITEHFGIDLDCRDASQLHSCGKVYFDPKERTVTSISLLQNTSGTSKQDIVTALSDKFGPAGDRFDAYLWRKHAVDQYVWGAFTEDHTHYAHDFTAISGPKHWQVEAFIAEPTTQRKTVIVQINRVEGDAAVSGGGGIKF